MTPSGPDRHCTRKALSSRSCSMSYTVAGLPSVAVTSRQRPTTPAFSLVLTQCSASVLGVPGFSQIAASRRYGHRGGRDIITLNVAPAATRHGRRPGATHCNLFKLARSARGAPNVSPAKFPQAGARCACAHPVPHGVAPVAKRAARTPTQDCAPDGRRPSTRAPPAKRRHPAVLV